MTTGQRLAELRKAAGLTQRQLGDAVGVTDQTISNFERDSTRPDVGVALAIAQRLGVTVEDLFVPAVSTESVEGRLAQPAPARGTAGLSGASGASGAGVAGASSIAPDRTGTSEPMGNRRGVSGVAS